MCVPVTLGLDGGTQLGVAGAARERRAAARMVTLQVAVLHVPADVGVVVVGPDEYGPGGEWDWTLFLPHAEGVDVEAVTAHAAASRDGTTARHLVVVVDGEPPRPCARELFSKAAGAGVSVVWCASTRERLPRACGHVLVVDSSARARLTHGGDEAVELVPDHASEPDCLAAARALAARVDGIAGAQVALPHVVGFRDSLSAATGVDPADPGSIADLWSRGDGARLPCLIGRSAAGPVWADLDVDGPHALVVGTTGSGKSELFTTMLASLAVCVTPHRLGFLLVDFKGGAAFDRLAALPHTAGVVTDLDGALAQRVLVSLEAELRRRMRLLRDRRSPTSPCASDGTPPTLRPDWWWWSTSSPP